MVAPALVVRKRIGMSLQTCVVTNPSDSNFDGCVQLNDLLDCLARMGHASGNVESMSYQGYAYETVLIGEQCWFAENLRAEAYRDGTSILSDLTGSDWQYLTTGASVYLWGK